MKNLKKHMSLYYWAGVKGFHMPASNETLSPEKYYLIRRLPLAELIGKDPVEIAEELIGITTSSEWRMQHRRAIMCGDFFCQGEQPWLYTRLTELQETRFNAPILPLKAWPHYAIVNLLPETVMPILCKT